jgi:hypothetical protein
MTILIPLIVVAFLLYSIAAVCTIAILHRFHIRTNFNEYILIPFMMIGAFLLSVAIGIVSVYHLNHIYIYYTYFYFYCS